MTATTNSTPGGVVVAAAAVLLRLNAPNHPLVQDAGPRHAPTRSDFVF